MPRFSHTDLVSELVELCNTLLSDVRQQLDFYRFSVYKHETAALISGKVQQLRLIVELLGDDLAMEPFRDHDAVVDATNGNNALGECSFSGRTSRLMTALTACLSDMPTRVQAQHRAHEQERTFMNSVQARRCELSQMCPHGSRQWSFFQSV